MKPIRLLPIVVLAGFALLAFKSIGLMTSGGYVLTGVGQAVGQDHGAATGEGGEITLPNEPTLEDDAPTMLDEAPTLGGEDDGHGEAAATEEAHGEDAAAEAGLAEAAVEHAAEAGSEIPDPSSACDLQPVGGAESEGADEDELTVETLAADCPLPADAIPTTASETGELVPMTNPDGSTPTEAQLLERLGERRAELDAYAAELAIRLSLVEAAEKRIDERVLELQAIEARINAMVEEKKAIDEGEFKGLVSLYEAMKPGDAAQIFDKLDMVVLLKVSRSMNPKKLAPIMAKMDPEVAQALTVNLAINEAEPTIDVPGEDLSALPQIVGQ